MADHIVEFLGAEWLLIAAAVRAGSPLQAVIRTATLEGNYRARGEGRPVPESEHFWVPAWGQPVPVDGPTGAPWP